MHCHPLKIALAVILGLSALSLLPNRFGVELRGRGLHRG